MNEHQELILEHYKNPVNFGKPDWQANAEAEMKNLSCGDELKVYLKVSKGIIKDIAFEGEGCSIAIATASMLSRDVKGKPIEEIKEYKHNKLTETLGIKLTSQRQLCAELSLSAIKKAIHDYQVWPNLFSM